MRDLADDLERLAAAGHRIVLARVVDVDGSGPREAGAAMAVADDGEVVGSVSGGCVEGAVVSAALALLEDGTAHVASFGYSDDEAFAVGLTCGGTVHLFLCEWDATGAAHQALVAAWKASRPVALAAVVDGPGVGSHLVVDTQGVLAGSIGDDDLERVVVRDAQGALHVGGTSVRRHGPCGEANRDDVTVAIEVFAPPPRLLAIGAVDFTGALLRAAKLLGFHVTVCDPREVFATRARFPEADEVVVAWPDRHLEEVGAALGPRDAVCVLTHDHKFDVPAILAALRTDVGYLGAMGSRRTHAERVERLRAEGADDTDLRRLHAPIGLDLGARTPEETAISILAEIIATRTGTTAISSLRDSDGSIHR